MLEIRRAKLSDAKALSELAEKSFRDTFADQNSSHDIEMHCSASYSEQIQHNEIADPECVTFVAEKDNELVAFARLQWGKSPTCVSADYSGELQRLYVDKHWHGKGLAYDLMDTCLATFKDKNDSLIWLGVWENNTRAISFYKKFKFEEVGDHIFSLGTDPQRDIIMERHLSNSSAE